MLRQAEYESPIIEMMAADLERLIRRARAVDQLPALVLLLEVALAEAANGRDDVRG